MCGPISFQCSKQTPNPGQKKTKWVEFFDHDDFYLLRQKMGSLNSSSKTNRLDEGCLIAYYMLKTLINEVSYKSETRSQKPPQINYPHETLFLYSNLINANVFNRQKMSLLLTLPTKNLSEKNDTVCYDVSRIQYSRCCPGLVPYIKIYITSLNGLLTPFTTGPVIIRLHFIRTRN